MLKPKDVQCNAALVCKRWCRIAGDVSYWRHATLDIPQDQYFLGRSQQAGQINFYTPCESSTLHLMGMLGDMIFPRVATLTVVVHDAEAASKILKRFSTSVRVLSLQASMVIESP